MILIEIKEFISANSLNKHSLITYIFDLTRLDEKY
jgi:hypothetical protein